MSDLVEFFSIKNSTTHDEAGESIIRPNNLGKFGVWHKEKYDHQEGFKFVELDSICERLVQKGWMWRAGVIAGTPPMGNCYYSSPPETWLEYGAYDNAILGFGYIYENFKQSVIPIEVEKVDGSVDIGTGFMLSSNLIITARHVVESMNHIKLLGCEDYYNRISSIKVHDIYDVCVIHFEDGVFEKHRYFLPGSYEILDDVLTMGYPPMPGFENVLVAEVGQIGSRVISSRGKVCSIGRQYFDGQEYILINNRIKGGNSGGPLINDKGLAVGVISAAPSTDGTTIDQLGYGIAIPLSKIISRLDSMTDLPYTLSEGILSTLDT